MPGRVVAALEGGTLVVSLRAGAPSRLGGLTTWSLFGRDTGARAISLRYLELSAGLSPGWRDEACDEVLYVLAGKAAVFLNGWRHEVEPDTGIFLARGVSFAAEVASPGPMTLVSSRCPEPSHPAGMHDDSAGAAVTHPPAGSSRPDPSPIVALADRDAVPTGDRWYRVLVDQAVGCRQVTQFVGSIPPGRAPDHYHHYEEVLCVLRGRGVMWAGATSAPIDAGSCVYLPEGQVHCVENTGAEELRMLGVFYPAGSPAVRYAPPDGSP